MSMLDSRAANFTAWYALHLVPAAMLFVAAGWRWPYAFYMVLRIIVCFAAALNALHPSADRAEWWRLAFAATAVVFNPIVPLHLTAGIWAVLNIAAALLFIAHVAVIKRPIGAREAGAVKSRPSQPPDHHQ